MRLALLIDADNMSAECAPRIFGHASSLGTPVIRRLYGRLEAITGWYPAARDNLCEMRVHAAANGKNGADIALAVDAMDLVHGRWVDAFCIVSNDRDFVPLGLRLRAARVGVHVICRQTDPRHALAFDSALALESPSRLLAAFRQVVGNRPDLSLAEAGTLLRAHRPDLFPAKGKAPLRKALEADGGFVLSGSGSKMRVRLAR